MISLGRKFEAVAPLLWMKAGSQGERIDSPVDDWTLPENAVYGVLFDVNQWRDFVDAVVKRDDIRHVFIVTDSNAAFQQILSELPTGVEGMQLYSDYLQTFEINTKGNA